jgi:TetR/AcrR family transcriptional repressor of nem operon
MDRTEQYQDTRERILDIGQTLVSGRGFSALGLNEILTKAEVPKGSFYHYFQSKEGFGVALLERYFNNYLQHASTLLRDDSTDVTQRLLTYFSNWRKVAVGCECPNMCLAVKLAAEVADLSEPMRLALANGMQRITEQITAAISDAQEKKQFPAQVDAVQLAESLYGMWVGASLLTKVSRNMTAMDLAYKQTEQMLKV